MVEHLRDKLVTYRLLNTTLVAHVVDDVVAQVLDAQQVGRITEDVSQSLRETLLLVGTDHYVCSSLVGLLCWQLHCLDKCNNTNISLLYMYG